MWGFRSIRNRKLANEIADLIKNPELAKSYNPTGKSEKNQDQVLLREYIWDDLASLHSMTHASYHCKSFSGSNIQAFTVQRPKTVCFVGCSKCCDPKKYKTTWPVEWECPLECRPKNHSDWLYC